MSFSIFLPNMIKLGPGCLHEIGDVAKDFYANHLFVITGSLLSEGEIKTRLVKTLNKENIMVTFFTFNKGEPTTDHIDEAICELVVSNADCVVAIGGGSVIDLAKAVSFLAVNRAASLNDIPGMNNLNRLPLIAIPTTAGTGSEVTKVTVITDSKTNIKRNPAHAKLIPDVAILDPELTVSLPKNITAYTGLDALAHAMEAYVSTLATPLSDHYALEAIRLIAETLPRVYDNGEDIEAREKMLLASCYAGISFTNASTNLAHATARPLGARFHIPHGLSVAMLLPFVVEFGLEACVDRYAKIARALGSEIRGSEQEVANETLNIVRQFNDTFNIWEEGSKYLFKDNEIEESLPGLIKDTLTGNGVVTNRKLPSEEDIKGIYTDLFFQLNLLQ